MYYMYYLIETVTDYYSIGDNKSTIKIIAKSQHKEKLKDILKSKFIEAVKDDCVSCINGYKKDEIDEDINITDNMTIMYTDCGFDFRFIEYNIVSDENMEVV